MKARVFVSCGQCSEGEIDLANRIGLLLESLGFNPYVAVAEQTFRGVKENTFARLNESEYFLFVDLKRERLAKGKYRGSLFSHQEFAIAAFLEKPLIAFQEDGIKLEGVLSFVQGNSTKFSNHDKLFPLIAQKISAEWEPNWLDEIQIMRDPGQFTDAFHQHSHFPRGRQVRYYHLEVENHHRSKTAFNSYAYLEKVLDVRTGKVANLKLVEFKWRGVLFPNVVIPYASSRELDAFFVYHDSPAQLHLGALTDSPAHAQSLQAGDYELTFVVHSANFAVTNSTFSLHVGATDVNDIRFLPKTAR